MRWVGLSIFILALAWWFHLGLLMLAGYAVLGLVVFSRLLSAAWTRQLSAERTATASSCDIGDKLQLTVTVRNSGRLQIPWLLLEDSVPLADDNAPHSRIKLSGPRVTLVRLGRGESKTVQYEAQFRTRGYYQFGPLLAETGDLFGLQRTYRLLTDPHFVIVYPKVLPLETYDIESRRRV